MVIGSVMPLMSISWKASLPRSAPGTLPVSATMGTESSWAVAMPVTRLVAPGPRRPEADTDAAAGASVAVGSVCGSLLVADEDGAQLGVVGPDVVERQDDATGVAEDDVHALVDEGLAQRIGADSVAGR